MPATRASDPSWTACALVAGGTTCHCAVEALVLDDRDVTQRAVDKFVWQQRASPEGRAAARRGLDEQLAAVRHRRSPAVVAELLRLALMLRLLEDDPADGTEVDPLLAELGALAAAIGDARTLGEAATLRALRAVTAGRGEAALADAATALATLTDITTPEPGAPGSEDPVEWARLLSRALNGLVLVLLKLGAHEVADEVSLRAVQVAEFGGTAMDRLVHQLNRVRLQLAWALRLERGGRQAAAAARFLGAAQTAQAASHIWGPALRRPPGSDPAATECAIIGSAFALARPGPEHLAVLEGLREMAHFVEDRILLGIATARCLMADDRPAEAAQVLEPLRAEIGDDHSEAVLAIALHREFAHVHEVARGVGRPSDALTRYATVLECELWDLREARLAALRSHSEHRRLAREHGAVAAQALQDPLTGLPNRRALEQRLAEIATDRAGSVHAVALVDLDGFKIVNDVRSHAAGDAVLCSVAGCLRTTLRSHDLVARYGGDEFVVVLPGTPLPTARSVLARTVEAVARLPRDVGAGVTISVGVVVAPAGGDATTALAAADAAMYRAKRAGGDRVAGPELEPVLAHPGRAPRLRAVPDLEPDSEADTAALPRIAAAVEVTPTSSCPP